MLNVLWLSSAAYLVVEVLFFGQAVHDPCKSATTAGATASLLTTELGGYRDCSPLRDLDADPRIISHSLANASFNRGGSA